MRVWLSILVALIAIFFLLIKFAQYHLDKEYADTPSEHAQRTIPGESLRPPNPQYPLPPSRSVLHIFEHAAICSDCTVCSNIGRDILQKANGSAVDAAIATLLCNGLLGMQSMGLGGGLLMNIFSQREQRAYSILAREVAPLHLNLTAEPQAYSLTPLSIAVPTEVMGYAVAHERFGKLRWQQLIAPTLEICRRGYTLSKHQHDALFMNGASLQQNALLREMFWNTKTNRPHAVGAHVQPPDALCRTYEHLSAAGARSFYTGELAQQIAADLQELGSAIILKDLQRVRVEIVTSPVSAVGEHLLHFTPPPGSGAIVALVLNILSKRRHRFMRHGYFDALDTHRIVEALKFGFVERWKLDSQTTEKYLRHVISEEFALRRAHQLNEEHTLPDISYYSSNDSEELHPQTEYGTTHISMLAPNGDAVAATSSINFYFGSGRSGSRTGIIFNNAMADFSIRGVQNYFKLPYTHASNRIRPGVSPMSSMSPLIVTDRNGNVRVVVGAAGGTKIISVLTQLLVRILWLDYNIKSAIDAPRFHHQTLPDVLEYEYGVEAATIAELEQKLHKTSRYRERGSAVCGIEQREGVVYANADYRKESDVAGF